MKLTPEERQKKKEQFAAMSTGQKAEHIWEYYKAAILLGLLLLVILVSSIRTAVARKDPVLYMAYTNVTTSAALETRLTEDYIISRGYDLKEQEVSLYTDLYLSGDPSPENYEYAYTCSMKLMATIEADDLDLVLMNREAYDLCSGSNYLLDLTQLIPAEDPRYSPYLTENLVVLEDNGLEYDLDAAEEYIAVTETVPNALEVSGLPPFRDVGFTGEVYLGVISTSPRLAECADYLAYLTE